MKKSLLLLLTALVLISCMALPALAEADDDGQTDGDVVYSLYDEQGSLLTMRAGRMYVDDEYIASDNRCYRIASVDDGAAVARAVYTGDSAVEVGAQAAFASLIAQAESKKLIGMYSTHSDESYVPTDGESSLLEGAGIYDVGNALKEQLEEHGIEVVYSEETFHPHDAGAYRRSRATAEELIKQQPDALLDIHRDAIPAEQYETKVDGEEMSKVRLFVGRNNPNSDANKAFAKELKAAADDKYPGLVKDIYIGKGNYNQELYPQALLLEMGTHEIDKEKVITSTEYLADVINDVLYGGSASAETNEKVGQGETGGAVKGMFWLIGIAAVAAAAYALVSTGKLEGAWGKIKRGTSEITGGLMGDKPDDEDKWK